MTDLRAVAFLNPPGVGSDWLRIKFEEQREQIRAAGVSDATLEMFDTWSGSLLEVKLSELADLSGRPYSRNAPAPWPLSVNDAQRLAGIPQKPVTGHRPTPPRPLPRFDPYPTVYRKLWSYDEHTPPPPDHAVWGLFRRPINNHH